MKIISSIRKMLRKPFAYILDLIYSNDRMLIKQLVIDGRYQLVWIAEGGGRRIALGVFEKNESNFMEGYIKTGDVCVDIGANIGYYTNLFSSCVGESGRVVSIEPIPRNCALIRLNNFLNNKETIVIVYNVAVGSVEKDETQFSVPNITSSFASVYHKKKRSKSSYAIKDEDSTLIKVPLKKVDAILKETHIDKIDIVKIDVEGYEYEVLLGMRATLENKTSQPRLIMVELNTEHLEYYNSSISKIVEYLAEFGYQPEFLKNGNLYPCNETNLELEQNIFFTLD